MPLPIPSLRFFVFRFCLSPFQNARLPCLPLPRGRTGRAGASIQQGIRRQLEEENRKLKQLVGDSPKAQLPGRGPARSQVSVVAGARNHLYRTAVRWP
jgi:hypothetical protein